MTLGEMEETDKMNMLDTKGLLKARSVNWGTVRRLMPDIHKAETAVVSGPPWAPSSLDPLSSQAPPFKKIQWSDI